MNRGLNRIFNSMMQREGTAFYETADLRAVPPGIFQVLYQFKKSLRQI